ncbi:MAG: enoyl-CoA hydratase/isomerase family protein [Candidatus Hydrogenedentes bacterium]|nr:enoyl-CoA hydratase/isomerase family protein [Candidatus Hydrogenedentota bacterium]
MTTYENIQVERADGYGVIAMNRPKANALSAGLVTDIRAGLAELREDTGVRCILITSALERFFSGGADIPSLRDSLGKPPAEVSLTRDGLAMVDEIESCPKPVVAVVGGMALGGGCELSLACHLRIASEAAQFGQPEINLGIIPGWGGTHRLPRLIGEARAMDWLLTGRMVSAQEAFQAGLVCKVVPAAQLMDAAKELAVVLASKPAVATRVTLHAVRERSFYPERGAELELAAFQVAGSSKDAAEGVAAFVEKRAPRFTDV